MPKDSFNMNIKLNVRQLTSENINGNFSWPPLPSKVKGGLPANGSLIDSTIGVNGWELEQSNWSGAQRKVYICSSGQDIFDFFNGICVIKFDNVCPQIGLIELADDDDADNPESQE